MSDEARAYVKLHSPFKNGTWWFHYVLADLANCGHGYELYATDASLLEEWPALTSRTITRGRADLIASGHLAVLKQPAAGNPGRYRFEFLGHEEMTRSPIWRPKVRNLATLEVGDCSSLTEVKQTARVRRQETPFPSGRFSLTGDMKDWGSKTTPGVDLFNETSKFKDHALSHDRRCKDWVAAWRNWMRGAYERGKTAGTLEHVPVANDHYPLFDNPEYRAELKARGIL